MGHVLAEKRELRVARLVALDPAFLGALENLHRLVLADLLDELLEAVPKIRLQHGQNQRTL